jgi:hypothetical protein
MKKTTARFVLSIAATLVLALACYGLARAYLYYEALRAERMIKELGDVKIGDPESQVVAILGRYGRYRAAPEDFAKFDKADYEYLVEIGPSGVYYVIDLANTDRFYRLTRAILSGLNPRFRRALGLRRWSVYGRVGFKDNKATAAFGMVMVEGGHEWLLGDWILAKTIPPYEIKRFMTSTGVSWPHDLSHYLVKRGRLDMEKQNGGGEGADVWITPAATDDERRSAHEFGWQCLTSRSGCRTLCDLYPVGNEYATTGTWQQRRDACVPGSSNTYW